MIPLWAPRMVRYLHLVLSISILTLSSFLLHYRTQNHPDFIKEPLTSCISGAIAFIFSLWTILNHKTEPYSRTFIYLHGLCCIAICGLLLSASIISFIDHNKEPFCLSHAPNYSKGLKQSKLLFKTTDNAYQDGHQYISGEVCKNSYVRMDEACGVIGIIATIMWLLDLCLIFGLCTPKAHVEPEVLEDYSTMGESHSWNTGPQTIVRGIGSYEDYCDALERKKKELHRPMPWASDNSSKQIQDLNELSEQQTFYEGIASTDSLNLEMLPFETSVISGLPNEASGAMSSPFITDHDNADAIHLQFSGFITPPVVALAPPPHPRTKWEYSPSPIIQGSTSTPIPPSATPPSCTLHEISSQHEATSVYACYTLSTSPPSCVESSSDSSCYVSNSTQQGYLPNFVNIAARNEQKQYSRRVNGSPPGSVVPTESPLHIPNRQSPSISRSRDEAQRYSQIKNEAKQRNQLNSLSLSPFNHNGPCFLAADTTSSSGLESPRSSLKSFLSNNQLEQNQSPYTPTQQIQGQEVREPMMTTRQNSKLSVMALKNNFHNISVSSSIKSIENDGNK